MTNDPSMAPADPPRERPEPISALVLLICITLMAIPLVYVYGFGGS